MDNLCHTLTGAALGYAGLAGRTRHGMTTLLVASNLPDIDVAVFLTDTLAVSFRRGWTHGVLAQVVLPALLASLVFLVGRRGVDSGGAMDRGGGRGVVWSQLLLLSYVGLYSHIFLDYLNSYGIRLLMPFSQQWFYGDALYIFDPLMWITLAVGVLLARRAAVHAPTRASRPARLALAVAGGYCVVMLLSNVWARAEVRDGLTRAGRPADTRFMVTPVFGNPFRREVLVDTGPRYEKGSLWFEPAPHFRPLGYGVDRGLDEPEVRSVLARPRTQAYLGWSRFPFFVVDRTATPPRVLLNDYRYTDAGGRAGWAGLRITLDP